MQQTKAERAKNLRYKRSALASIGWYNIREELDQISSDCYDVRWYIDSDEDNLVAALDGDEEEAFEFKLAFADLEAKCELLQSAIDEQWDLEDYFDDCTVALIGNRYETVGYDGYQEDYYSLTSFEQHLAETEAGKRVCRWTKAEMLSKIGQCMGILLAYYDIRQAHDYLKATMDILRGENMSILKVIKEIEAAYERQCDNWRGDAEFDRLCSTLPDRIWIE